MEKFEQKSIQALRNPFPLFRCDYAYLYEGVSVRPSVGVFLREPKIAFFRRAAPGSRIWCRVFGLVFFSLPILRGFCVIYF